MATLVDAARSRSAPRALVALVQVAGLVTLLGFRAPRGFPLDDAWIHQVVARVFARTLVLGFDPSLPGSGATSLLYAALLSVNDAFVHASPPLFAIALGSMALLAAGQLVYETALDDGFSRGEAVLAALAFGATGNVLWFAVSGMEVTLAMALGLGALAFHFRRARLSEAVAGVFLVCSFFTRPETLLLGVLLLAVRFRGLRDAALLLAPVVVGAAVYAALNVAHTGHLFPVTLRGRKWLAEIGLGGATTGDVAWILSQQWLDRLAEYTLGTPSPLVFFPTLGVAAFGAFCFVSERRTRIATVCAWAVVQTLAYAALLPSIGHGGRYQPFVPAVFAMAAVLGALRLGQAVTARLPRLRHPGLVAWAFVVPLVVGMLHAVREWAVANALAVAHEDNTEIAVARDVAALPKDAVVASFDIGAVAYFSGRRIEDLGGLVRPEVVTFLRDGRTVDWLRSVKATHLVLPLGYRPSFPEAFNFGDILGIFDSPELRLETVADRVTPLERWIDGVRATSNSAPRQRLYRIVWQRGAP